MGYLIVGRNTCPYCRKAQDALNAASLPFRFLDLDDGPSAGLYRSSYAPFVPRTHTTVPCIFYDHCFIGGFDQLADHLS